MKRFLIIIFLISGVALPSSPLFSQEEQTIEKDVRVVREYSPIVSDAIKINQMPEMAEPEVSSPEFNYRLSGNAMTGKPEVVALVPAMMAKEPAEELSTTHLSAYLGNYDVLGASLLYNLIQNDKYALNIRAGHESSWGKLTLEDGNDVKAPYHDTNGSLFLRHFFKQKTLGLNMAFNHNVYRYYGYQTILEEGRSYSLRPGESQIYEGKDLLPDSSPYLTAFDVDLSLLNHVSNRYATQYKLNMGFSTFANAVGVKENQFRFAGDFDFALGEFTFRLGAGMNHASVNHSDHDFLSLSSFPTRQQTLVYLNPSMVRKEEKYTLKMGVRIATEFDDLGDNFYLSPDVTAQLNIAEGIVGLEGGVTGELRPSAYRTIMAENPYTAPDIHVMTAFRGVKFFLGTVANFSRLTSFAGKVEYNILHDEHFFENRRYYYGSDDENYSNLFDVVYDDGRLLTVSGEFNLDLSSDLNVILRAAYNDWNLDSLQYAWHRPKRELGFRTVYRPNESLTFYITANILGERFVSLPADLEGEVNRLRPVYDFNIGSTYQLNRYWNFFAEVRNMAASKYYRWSGYPMFGVNARVGVGYSF